jgi:hypothetical protein
MEAPLPESSIVRISFLERVMRYALIAIAVIAIATAFLYLR